MTHIPTMVCATCCIQMKIAKQGILVRMVAAIGDYYTIYADQYECDRCDAKVVGRWAQQPSMGHYEGEAYRAEAAGAALVVDMEPHIPLSRRESTAVFPHLDCHRCGQPGTQFHLAVWWCQECGAKQELEEAKTS